MNPGSGREFAIEYFESKICDMALCPEDNPEDICRHHSTPGGGIRGAFAIFGESSNVPNITEFQFHTTAVIPDRRANRRTTASSKGRYERKLLGVWLEPNGLSSDRRSRSVTLRGERMLGLVLAERRFEIWRRMRLWNRRRGLDCDLSMGDIFQEVIESGTALMESWVKVWLEQMCLRHPWRRSS